MLYLTKLALPTGEILGMPMENFKGNARVSDAASTNTVPFGEYAGEIEIHPCTSV